MDLGLANKVVLVTGSSRGLGYAAAEQFLKEGARTIINARSGENLTAARQSLLEKTGREAEVFAGNMTDPSFAANAAGFVEQKYGLLDILVTNAGGPPPGSIENLTDTQWAEGIELSFMSHMRLIKACLPLLRKSDSPSVLTVTSFSVKQPIPNLLLSNSIRAATVGLTKTLALEHGHEKIRFNSILPGWTSTERVTELFENRARMKNSSAEQEKQLQEKEIALGRIAEPQEFAKVAVFLSSPAASYLTGVMLQLDGGAFKGML